MRSVIDLPEGNLLRAAHGGRSGQDQWTWFCVLAAPDAAALQDREGAWKAGRWPRPWPASKQKKLAAVTTGLAEATRPSLRNGFNA